MAGGGVPRQKKDRHPPLRVGRYTPPLGCTLGGSPFMQVEVRGGRGVPRQKKQAPPSPGREVYPPFGDIGGTPPLPHTRCFIRRIVHMTIYVSGTRRDPGSKKEPETRLDPSPYMTSSGEMMDTLKNPLRVNPPGQQSSCHEIEHTLHRISGGAGTSGTPARTGA
jgi:hypothetical protein